MLRESWKRPSILVVGWVTLLVLVFVVRGDLRIERAPAAANANATPPAPVVVRSQSAARHAVPAIVRSGRVFDAAGFLVVGAEVGTGRVDATELARTDADGRFQVELRAGQPTDVTLRAPGHRPVWVRLLEGTPDPVLVQLAPAAPWDLDPTPLPPLRFAGEGRVQTRDGQPVAGAQVGALGTEAWARTDANGRYVLPLAGTAPTIVVHREPQGDADGGLCARSEPLQLDRDRGLVPLPDLVAEAACVVRGIVRDHNGSAVAGVPVRLRGNGLDRLVESGTGGAFRIGGLEPGGYTLRPFAFRGAIGRPLALHVDRALVDCELDLQPLAERRLRVVDLLGAPVADAHVVAAFAGECTSVQRTDAQGWAQVRLAEGGLGSDWNFDVRTGAQHTQATVERFEPAQATLVVALR